jgi:hypothetical protein
MHSSNREFLSVWSFFSLRCSFSKCLSTCPIRLQTARKDALTVSCSAAQAWSMDAARRQPEWSGCERSGREHECGGTKKRDSRHGDAAQGARAAIAAEVLQAVWVSFVADTPVDPWHGRESTPYSKAARSACSDAVQQWSLHQHGGEIGRRPQILDRNVGDTKNLHLQHRRRQTNIQTCAMTESRRTLEGSQHRAP